MIQQVNTNINNYLFKVQEVNSQIIEFEASIEKTGLNYSFIREQIQKCNQKCRITIHV